MALSFPALLASPVSPAFAKDTNSKSPSAASSEKTDSTQSPTQSKTEKPGHTKWGVTGIGWDTHLISYGRDVWGAGDQLTGEKNGLIHPWIQAGMTKENFRIFAGTWLDINSNSNDSVSGDVQEIDLWLGFGLKLGRFDLGMNLQRWQYGDSEEYVLDSSLAYNDYGQLFKTLALNPGLTLHTQLSSENFDESNVLVAKISPGFALSKREVRPIWLSIPIEVGFQQDGFRAHDAGHSYSSIGADFYFPLISLPQRFGNWSVNAKVSWFDTDEALIPENPDASFTTAKLGLLYFF